MIILKRSNKKFKNIILVLRKNKLQMDAGILYGFVCEHTAKA